MTRRWVLSAAKEPLIQVTAADGTLAAGSVRVAVEACALGLLDWNVAMLDALPLTPVALGTEAVGRVVEVGPGASLRVGQRVGVTPLASSCGRCDVCAAGHAARCELARWHGLHANGALTEVGVFDAQHLVPVPEDVDASLLAATLGGGWTALAAVDALGPAPLRVAVLGFGGVGHQVALHARAAGHEVCGEELEPARRAWAASEGFAAWGDRRVDACVVCTPSQQGLQRALKRVTAGGRLLLVGQAPTTRLDLPLAELVTRQLRLEGVFLGSRAVLDRALAAVATGRVRPRVHDVGFEGVDQSLYALRDLGFAGRMVVRVR